MTPFSLVTANLEHGCRNCDSGTLKGVLLKQSHPDVIFIQESAPERLHLGPSYQLLDYSNLEHTTSNLDLIEPMDIYVNLDSSWKVVQLFQIDSLPQKSPRQSKIVVLQHQHTHLKITLANVHLVGGRYDENDQLGGFLNTDMTTIQDLKTELLERLLHDYQVDLIAGDFNSDLNCYLHQGQLDPHQLSYFQRVSPGKSLQTYQYWNVAPYDYLYSQGYRHAHSPAKYTSIFKTHPDALWYSPLTVINPVCQIIDLLTPNLSDHHGLQIKLTLKSKSE